MLRTIEAVIDEDGTVHLSEPIHLLQVRRALVVILDDESDGVTSETARLSEAALAADWNRPEEEAAWSHLQPEP